MVERLTREERRQQTRDRLLAATCELFAERGIHGTSLDDIAAEAGLTKGAVYSNFSGKDDLLAALITRPENLQANYEVVDLVSNSRQPLPERFSSVGSRMADLAGAQGRGNALILIEFWLYAMRNPAAREKFVAAMRELHASVTERVAAEMADDPRSPVDPADLVSLISGLNLGLQMLHLLDPEQTPAKLFGTGMELLLRPVIDQEPAVGPQEGSGR